MDYSKLKLVFSFDWYDEEIDDSVEYDLFTIRFIKDRDFNEKEYTKLKSIMIPTVKSTRNGWNICEEIKGFKNIESFYENLDQNFCKDMSIIYDNKYIGSVSFNRIFVNSFEELDCWLDNEAPNSMNIGHYIKNKDLKKVEARYIGIVDEIKISEEFNSESLHMCIIEAINHLLDNHEFGLYYLYTIPKSSNIIEYQKNTISDAATKTYKEYGFKIVDEKELIMRKNMWSRANRETGGGGFYTYL